MKRYVTVNLLTGKPYLMLWANTEYQEEFPIKAIKTKPYVMAYGVRYDLTNKEIGQMNKMISDSQRLGGKLAHDIKNIKSKI